MSTKPPPRSLPPAPIAYDRQDQDEIRRRIRQLDEVALKNDRDVLLRPGVRLLMYGTDDNKLYAVKITGGALVVALA